MREKEDKHPFPTSGQAKETQVQRSLPTSFNLDIFLAEWERDGRRKSRAFLLVCFISLLRKSNKVKPKPIPLTIWILCSLYYLAKETCPPGYLDWLHLPHKILASSQGHVDQMVLVFSEPNCFCKPLISVPVPVGTQCGFMEKIKAVIPAVAHTHPRTSDDTHFVKEVTVLQVEGII